MNYPKTLVIRNSYGGMIWQAYHIHNDEEKDILESNAQKHGFICFVKDYNYTDETSPGWRETNEWKECLGKRRNPEKFPENPIYSIFSKVKRYGPYWLSGYKDWLIFCYSVRSIDDLKGFEPIACYSELSKGCSRQWLICKKDGEFYIDKNFGNENRKCGYGLQPVKIDSNLYESHIYDWIKSIIKNTQ